MGIVNTFNAVLPPKSFQRWHHEVDVPVNLMCPLLTHLDRVGDGVQDCDCLLVGAVFLIGITAAAHGHVCNGWDRDDARHLLGA